MRSRKLLLATAIVGCMAMVLSGPAGARQKQKPNPLKGEGFGMKIVANVPYEGGTDMEFITQKGRDYALTGSAPGVGGAKAGGFRVIDITDPEKPFLAALLACSLYQGDIQISHDQKTAIMGADSAGGPDGCLAVGKLGFLTIDITDVLKPKAIGFAEISTGSHNITAHPKKPYVYNSNSNLAPSPTGSSIEIWSIKNPAKPKLVNTVLSLPHAPHDISFSPKGDLAVTAAISHVDIYNTSDPENPTLAYTTQCPGCSITHDAKFTPDMTHVIVGDEGGGGGGYPCPGGALYFYQLQTSPTPLMVLTGVYEPQELIFARDGQTGPAACTSHVFSIAPDSKHMAISWYSAGTRYLDISSMTGATFGQNQAPPGGVKEVAWFMPDGGVTWSSKIYKNEKYVYSNDEHRGFDVFKVTAK